MKEQNVKTYYQWTSNYDESQPNNNYNYASAFIFEQNYTVENYFSDLSITYKNGIEGEYIIIDKNGNETGERYQVYKIELTDENICY